MRKEKHTMDHLRTCYLGFALIYLVGVIGGTIDFQRRISQTIPNQLVESKAYVWIESKGLSTLNMKNLGRTVLLCWLMTLSMIGVIYFYILFFYEGYCLGMIASWAIGYTNSKACYFLVFSHLCGWMLCIFLCLFWLGKEAIQMVKAVLKQPRKYRHQMLSFSKNTLVAMLCMVFIGKLNQMLVFLLGKFIHF